jgi:hypothetical protein
MPKRQGEADLKGVKSSAILISRYRLRGKFSIIKTGLEKFIRSPA